MAIKTLDRLIEVLTLQKQNLGTYQTEVGATLADITQVTNDLNNLNAIVAYADTVNGVKKSVFQIKQDLIGGDPDTPIAGFATFPAAPTLTAPVGGTMKRTNDRNTRFKLGPGYNQEIDDALGLTTSDGEAADPNTVQPDLELFAALQGNFDFSGIITNRGDSDLAVLSAAPINTGDWQELVPFTGKAFNAHWPGTGNAPVQLQCRIQLRKKNENYGVPSDIVTVTVIP